MENQIKAAYLLTLGKFDNQELASLHLALSSFGVVQELNFCYEMAVKYNLLNADRKPHDEYLLEAVEFEVQRRIAAGTYQ